MRSNTLSATGKQSFQNYAYYNKLTWPCASLTNWGRSDASDPVNERLLTLGVVALSGIVSCFVKVRSDKVKQAYAKE